MPSDKSNIWRHLINFRWPKDQAHCSSKNYMLNAASPHIVRKMGLEKISRTKLRRAKPLSKYRCVKIFSNRTMYPEKEAWRFFLLHGFQKHISYCTIFLFSKHCVQWLHILNIIPGMNNDPDKLYPDLFLKQCEGIKTQYTKMENTYSEISIYTLQKKEVHA